MKAIMISIRPEWVAKILNKEKTIEIRKTKPSCDLPVKVYIYCTKSFNSLRRFPNDDRFGDLKNKFDITNHNRTSTIPTDIWNGKVVAEFTLNQVDTYDWDIDFLNTKQKMYYIKSGEADKTCLKYENLVAYGKGKTLYGWHIDDIKIYEQPKDLSEFTTMISEPFETWHYNHREKLTRPPQSWCYCEGLEE